MHEPLLLPILVGAVSLAAVHSLAPDHWLPIAALSRVQGWSAGRTARITIVCGAAHVTTSVALGLVGIALGLGVFERYGAHLESFAGMILIGFGLVYGVLGLRHAAAHVHGHHHHHYDHVHNPSQATPWGLFAVFAADPCVAILPLLLAAAPLGWTAVALVVLAYEVTTAATMVALVLPARTAANSFVRGAWVHRYGDALAGGFIAVVGITVAVLGW